MSSPGELHPQTLAERREHRARRWGIWSVTGDARPIHRHLVNFEVLDRQETVWDSHTTEDDCVIPNDNHVAPAGNGTYRVTQPLVQHKGLLGSGFRIVNFRRLVPLAGGCDAWPALGARGRPDRWPAIGLRVRYERRIDRPLLLFHRRPMVLMTRSNLSASAPFPFSRWINVAPGWAIVCMDVHT